MRLFRFLRPSRLRRAAWMRWPLIILGLVCFGMVVWFGGPMTGLAVLSTVWLRVTIIATVVAIVLIYQIVRGIRRRRAARELEDAIVPEQPVGDAKVLAERMDEALATLKKSGGRTYLYDLPWYVIIGPPGVGKTTALRNSGIEFPLADTQGGVVEGFGGTRNCDWWFAEDAILIDTAGRYTTQDSDKAADETSWQAFLRLLKKGRPKQPINGVLLAFSVDEIMTASPEALAHQATTVRARLAEIHETLKIDFPVYVLFTKADLIAGFREYFGNFGQARRKSVWGVTFQTKERHAQTWQSVAEDFDNLVSRLSDEIIDRMNEELDSISRIAIFGLPGQMALMRDNVSEFLRRVFEPTRYKTNAILRGFYFTSGTQEGTPIDQVLGEMSRDPGAVAAFQPSFMSGRGKSYFLHDLLEKVIFAERDWVSYDEKAVRRSTVLRTAGFSLVAIVTAGLMGALGFSYWQNASLVRTANAEAARYAREHSNEIAREVIDSADLRPVIQPLQDLRLMSAGYGSSREDSIWEKLGLGQRARLEAASDAAYSDALERMLRPRLILELEQELPRLQNLDDTTGVFRALKVYMLLGGAGETSDDAAIKAYFSEVWRNRFSSFDQLDMRDQLNAHLEAMLELDDTRDPLVGVTAETVTMAQEAIVQLPLVDQAYATILDRVGASGIPDFNLSERLGINTSLVFRTTDGSDINELGVPALYTYEGYWGFFAGEIESVIDRLEADQWVFGEAGNRVDFDDQLSTLGRTLHSRYQREFRDAWEAVFDRLSLSPMAADRPSYDALAAAASPTASPILGLVKAVDDETRLTREFDEMAALTPEMLASGGAGDAATQKILDRFRSRGGFARRLLMDTVMNGDKAQERAGGQPDDLRRPIELIERQFEDWHRLLEGSDGRRPVDQLIARLEEVRKNVRGTAMGATGNNVFLPQLLSDLTSNNSQIPEPLARFMSQAEQDFRSEAQDADLAEMNRALNEDVFSFCTQNVASEYPFSPSGRPISMDNVFGEFFGHGGRMDRYFETYLSDHVNTARDGFVIRETSPLADRLDPGALRQFYRARQIRDAFFPSGSQQPQVTVFVDHLRSHESVEDTILTVNGVQVISRPGERDKRIVWPGEGSGVTLELQTLRRRDQVDPRSFDHGRWAFVEFFRSTPNKQQDGTAVTITHTVGGYPVAYRFTAESTTFPFTMPELLEFDCPASLD